MLDRVFLPVPGPPPFLYDPALIATDVRLVTAFANGDIFLLRGELGFGKLRRVRLHGQSVEGSGPELVKFLMALPAAHRASISLDFLCRFLFLANGRKFAETTQEPDAYDQGQHDGKN
jgi:hypothetical protein